MSEFDGLWKQQNNPAGTKSVSSLQNVEVDTVQKKREDQNYDLDRTIDHFPSVWKVANNKMSLLWLQNTTSAKNWHLCIA